MALKTQVQAMWQNVQEKRITLTAYDADTGNIIPGAALPARIDGLGGPLRRITELR